MKKYIESHWLIFAIQGAVALIFGGYVTFTGLADLSTLIFIIGLVLLALGAIEIFNVIHRKRRQHSWGFSLAVAIIEIAVAIALLATKDLSIATHFTIIAGYTIVRGAFEILIGLRSLTNPVDRFLWIVTGVFGVALGFAALNSGNLDPNNTIFIKIFGTYMMVVGVANLVFGLHNKSLAHLKPKAKKK